MPAAPEDYRRIHDTFRPRILRYLARLVGKHEADDLAQVVMLKVSEGLDGFRGAASLSTWIYRIATNTALDHLRVRRAPAVEPAAEGTDGAEAVPPEQRAPSAESVASRAEMSACIRDFIERLPASYGTVLVLSELEGFGNAEIADILGIGLDAAKIRLHRARKALRAELEAGCRFERDAESGLACNPKTETRPGTRAPA